jgi:hypothetical protein
MSSKELVHRKRRAALDRLDDAELAKVVQELGPDGMAALVSEVGLADAGQWLALATPAQVLEVLDAELWQAPAAGESERFDPRRFVTWLEALVEVSAELAADRLADAPQELVVAGLYRQALVFDTDELWLSVARGLMDPAIDDQPQLEVGEHLMVGRGLDGWDAVVAAVLELADRHPETAAAVLDQCRELTDRAIGEADLSEALLDEGREDDAALEREDRRARRGYVAPHAARSFLALAVEIDLETQIAFGGRDPVTAAYFRDWEREGEPTAAPAGAGLARAGVGGARPEELGYLVQVVMAACEIGGRPFTVEEAAEAVLAVCRVGEAVVGPAGPVDALFRYGYHVLHDRVVRRAREVGDRTGLAEPIPRLDGRFVGDLADLAAAEARVAAGRPMVEVEGVVEREDPDLPRVVAVPAAAAAALGASGATLVVCRIGETQRLRTLEPWDGRRWLLELPAEWCREAGIEVGQRVKMQLEAADAGLPEELAAALAADPDARQRWYALPESHQRQWREHVQGAKRAEIRRRRAALVAARLRG